MINTDMDIDVMVAHSVFTLGDILAGAALHFEAKEFI